MIIGSPSCLCCLTDEGPRLFIDRKTGVLSSCPCVNIAKIPSKELAARHKRMLDRAGLRPSPGMVWPFRFSQSENPPKEQE